MTRAPLKWTPALASAVGKFLSRPDCAGVDRDPDGTWWAKVRRPTGKLVHFGGSLEQALADAEKEQGEVRDVR